MKLLRIACVILFLWQAPAVAATYQSVDSYVSSFAGSTPERVELADRNDMVVGVARWACPEDGRCTNRYLASIFVLHRDANGVLTEIARSRAFEWQESAKTPALDDVEIKDAQRFEVALFHFAPVGRSAFVFIRRKDGWILAGKETYFLRMIEEHGDEAVGDTKDSSSINYLTGALIETHYRGNAWYSEKKCHATRSRARLANVDLFSNELWAYCP